MKQLSCLFASPFAILAHKHKFHNSLHLKFHTLASYHWTLIRFVATAKLSPVFRNLISLSTIPYVFSQQHRARKGSVPSQTSSSSGRSNEWLGAKAGFPQRTPPSDVPKAATVLAYGRRVLQVKCDWSNKV